MHATSILSRHRLARRLDIDPRTLARQLAAAGITPDFTDGRGQLFREERVPKIREAINTGR